MCPSGGHFYIRVGGSIDVKKPTTYEAQLKKIESRGCIVPDEERAIEILHRINYYSTLQLKNNNKKQVVL